MFMYKFSLQKRNLLTVNSTLSSMSKLVITIESVTDSKYFDIQTWTPIQRYDQELTIPAFIKL